MREWNVYLNGFLVDTVYFLDDVEEGDVYNCLVNHDGYVSDIQIHVGD